MQEHIAELLAASIEGINLQEVEMELDECRKAPEFLQGIFEVIASAEYADSIRRQAVIYLKMMVRSVSLWTEELTPENHAYIFQTVPIFVKHLPYKAIVSNYVRWVIRAGFTNSEDQEWSNLPDVISELWNEDDVEAVRGGFLLANALCGELKCVNVFNEESSWPGFMEEFSNMLLAAIVQLALPSDNFEILEFAFHCAYRLLFHTVDGEPAFMPIDSAEVGALVEASLAVVGAYEDSDAYYAYANAVVKFIRQMVRMCWSNIGMEGLSAYFGVAVDLFGKDIPHKIRYNLVQIILSILDLDSTWEFVEDSLEEFLKNIVLPVFALTEGEIELFDDSVTFVSEIHTREDARAEMANLMRKHAMAKERDDLLEAARELACEVFTIYADESYPSTEQSVDLFNGFLLFASVSTAENGYNPKVMRDFFRAIEPLFESNDALARCAAFMLAAETERMEPIPELAEVCINHLDDPCPAVRYYAVVLIAQFLLRSEDQARLREEYQPVLETLFSAIMELSGEFESDKKIGDMISNLVNVFNEDILPFAVDLSQQLLTFLAESSSSDEVDRGMAIISSFDNLVALVALNKEAREELGSRIFMSAIEIMKELPLCSQLFDSLMLPMAHCIHWSAFEPESWEFAEVAMQRITEENDVALGDLLDIISELLVKDEDFASRGDLVTSLIEFTVSSMDARMEAPDEWNELAKLAASIMIRLGKEHESVAAIFERVSEMTIQQISDQSDSFIEPKGLLILTNMLIFTDFEAFASIAGDSIASVLDFWLEIPIFPETVVSGLVVFESADDSDLQMRILYSITDMLCGDILSRSKDDGDTFDEEADSNTPYIWFDFSETLLKFWHFLKALETDKPDMFAAFMEQLQEEDHTLGDVDTIGIADNLEMIPTIAEWYHETKADDLC